MTTPTTVQVRLQVRADTAANWTSVNPILLTNELGLESDTKKFKIGNGTSAWVDLAYFPSIVSGGTVLGNLEIGTTGTLTFEGSTANGFETTLGVVDPTADRTILLPNQSGTVVVGGNASIVDADIAANAEIAVSKLADGAARQLLQTDAAGIGVEWTSNIDIPGTLDVTGVATFDNAVTIAGDLTVNGTTTNINTQNLVVEDKNIILADVATPTDVTADGGGITLKGATDKTINWIDATDAWTSSERFSVPLGSASAPSLTFTGDPNTGIYSPGADQVAISTNSVGRLFVDASGRIGVGTSSPAQRLQVGDFSGSNVITVGAGAASSSAIYFSDGNSGTEAYRGYVEYNHGSDALLLGTSGLERLRITSAGLVGVGTSTPGSYTEAPNFVVANTSGNCGATIASSASGYGALYFADGTTGDERYRGGLTYYHNYAGIVDKLLFTAGAVNGMTLTPTGLGVGTTSPSALLTVGAAYGGTPNSESRTVIQSAGNSYLTIGAGSSSQAGLLFADTAANNAGGILYTHSSDSLEFIAAGNERLRIDSSGRVGIGTSSVGAPLHVYGAATAASKSSQTGVFTVHSASTVQLNIGSENASPYGVWMQTRDASGTATNYPLVLNPLGGNVGIGTTTPSSKLVVEDSAALKIAVLRTATAVVGMGVESGPYVYSDGALQFRVGATAGGSADERARIDTSGRLLVGTSSPYAIGGFNRNTYIAPISGESDNHVVISATGAGTPGIFFTRTRGSTPTTYTVVQDGDTLGRIDFFGADGVDYSSCGARIAAQVDGTPGSDDLPSRLVFSVTRDGQASPTEALRIQNNGGIGTFGISQTLFDIRTNSTAGTTNQFFSCAYGASAVYSGGAESFRVWTNGNVQNTNNSYTAISDVKLKENVVDAHSQWADIKALKVRNYNFKEGQTHRQIGLIAQEVEPISPGLVYESPDRDADGNDLGTVTKSVNYSVLYMKAVKALQEAMLRIEDLEARLNAANL